MAQQTNERSEMRRRRSTVLIAALAVVLTTAFTIIVIKPQCDKPLQQLVDDAAPGTVVETPGGCIYREEIIIDKPLTLEAGRDTEIRGSDLWTDWTKNGSHWVKGTVPRFPAHGECRPGSSRCLWPAQVFFDGQPLLQVASDPKSGQFAVDGGRRIALANDPAGHTVEVTARRHWVLGKSENVTIMGFTMKHAANDSQTGAIMNRLHYENRGYPRWTVKSNVLSYPHAEAVDLANATDLNIIDNDIHHAGQLGIGGRKADLLIQGNRIHDNNTEGFDPGWEAGGVKTTLIKTLRAENNEVYDNAGIGFWCDMGCNNAVYSNNRIHHNEHQGIHYEISTGAKIFDNVVWENGYGKPDWGWGAGILSASSRDVEIYDNILAWNADGISINSAKRPDDCDACAVSNVNVHGNIILAKDDPSDATDSTASLTWLQDWKGVMFDPASDNRGANNRYWYPDPQGRFSRFAWKNWFTKLSEFNATPGESDGRYLTESQKNEVISSANLPHSPERY